ncbi:MAG: ABC transporter ATP-binding protein [Clostridia bacterium]|nr:ABC transporter ATP-binding protein [Clostridia bacterium]
MIPLIEFKDLYKLYPMGDTVVHAVDGISMTINEGEFVAIVGQSGSGKSTCMNIIGCLDVPTHGSYYLGGKDVSQMNDNELAEIRNKMIGFVFQQYNLLAKLNVVENVEVSMMYAGMHKAERRARALEVLERVGLSDKLKNLPKQLSGGQQQRVSIARALAGKPKLLLCDEPTGALDSKTGKEVLELLKEIHNEGNTVLLITHDNAIAAKADRIIRLEDGKVIYDGPAKSAPKMISVEDGGDA